MKPQTRKVLKALEQGPLTPMTARKDLGIDRLAARIHELRQAGYRIHSALIRVKTRENSRARIARYHLTGAAQ